MEITTVGAVVGLVITIALIIKKIEAAYAMMVGALIGGLVGGAGLVNSVNYMIAGAQEMMPTIIRVLASGVLAGTLIKSGAATKIAEEIILVMGERRALLAIALSAMILTSVGVFVDVAVITVAPIAISVGNKLGYSKAALLIALVGGGKSGNTFSPNPNTIVAAENFGVSLSSVMVAGFIPGLVGLAVTVLIAAHIHKKRKLEDHEFIEDDNDVMTVNLPSIVGAITAPVVVIILLMLKPIFGLEVDPLVALPAGGLIGMVAMKKSKEMREYLSFGLKKMMPVGILLVGTGAIAGIIKASQLQYDLIALVEIIRLPEFLLAPISGILMSAATASCSAASAIASSTFASTITKAVSPLAGAAMVHAGANVFGTLPQGSFFHISANSVNMNLADRMKLLPADSLVGFAITVTSTIIYGLIL